MNKIKALVLIITVSIVCLDLSACKKGDVKKETTATEKIENEVSSKVKSNINSNIDGISVEQQDDKTEEKGNAFEMPYYYLDDCDINFGTNTFAECGNQVACLSMVYSYYHPNTYIEPEVFCDMYKDYINSDGTVNKELYKKIASDLGIQEFEEPYDTVTAATYLKLDRAKIIVFINNPSIYGKGSSYIILNGLNSEKYMYVRDPNEENIKKYAQIDEFGEPMYNVYELTEATGANNTMYVFY